MNEQIKSLIESHKQALDGVGRYLEEAAFDLQRMIDDEDTELATLSAEDQEREEENSDERKSEIERALDAVRDAMKSVQRISLEPVEEEAEEEYEEDTDERRGRERVKYFPLQVRVDPQLLAELNRAAAPR